MASNDTSLDDGGTGGGGGSGGGGGGGVDIGINRSGTRIKMKVLNTPDGAKVFQGSYDSQRNEDCAFQVASDGVTRCVPTSIARSDGFFADAACTVPIGLSFPGCALPTYVAVPSSASTCFAAPTPGPRIYARGATHPTYYRKSGTTCLGPNTTPVDTFFYGITGAEIPPTSFQMATSAIE
jgi:hypothetical protein